MGAAKICKNLTSTPSFNHPTHPGPGSGTELPLQDVDFEYVPMSPDRLWYVQLLVSDRMPGPINQAFPWHSSKVFARPHLSCKWPAKYWCSSAHCCKYPDFFQIVWIEFLLP